MCTYVLLGNQSGHLSPASKSFKCIFGLWLSGWMRFGDTIVFCLVSPVMHNNAYVCAYNSNFVVKIILSYSLVCCPTRLFLIWLLYTYQIIRNWRRFREKKFKHLTLKKSSLLCNCCFNLQSRYFNFFMLHVLHIKVGA